MKKTFVLVIGMLLLTFSSCKKEGGSNVVSNSKNKILILGASRVEGGRPDYESFRYELWKLLLNGSWEFDFIGTQQDQVPYPDHLGISFDPDHEGRGGWTSGEILGELENSLYQISSPDIVIFSSPGGNDALQNLAYSDAIQNINDIIDQLQENNPNVTIVIESMAPGHSTIMHGSLQTFFVQMQSDVMTVATNQTTDSSQVIVVDMHTGFTDNLLADDVHYNELGASFIASRYYDVLKNILK